MNTKQKIGHFKLAGLIASIAMTVAAVAPAAGADEGDLICELLQTTATKIRHDFVLQDVSGGWLASGESESFELPLEAGQAVTVRGIGDASVRGMEIIVLDPRGEIVARHLNPGRDSMVEFTAVQTGSYTVKISIKSREVQRARYALVFAERTP